MASALVGAVPTSPRHRAGSALHAARPMHRARPGRVLLLLPPAAVLGAVALGHAERFPGPVQEAARALHLAFLTVGFGAVLTVDFHGLRWWCGRAQLQDVVRLANQTHLMVWVGYVGLALSGAVLLPTTLATSTLVKLAAVLVVGWNGAWFHRRQQRGPLPPATLLTSAAVSQAGWWTAAAIGFLHAHG